MKFSFTSYSLLCFVFLYTLFAETFSLPVYLPEPGVLDARAPPPKSPPPKSPVPHGAKPAPAAGRAASAAPGDPKAGYDKFLAYLKSPAGTAANNICFFSGTSNGVRVSTKLPDLAKKTGCQYTGTLLAKAGVPKEVADKFTHGQWTDISKQLATNARGKAKALVGDKTRPDAIFWASELPILQASLKKGSVTGIELWKMDAKGNLVGPAPFAATKKR